MQDAPPSDCQADIVTSVHQHAGPEIQYFLRAVGLVAISYRLLSIHELYEAVTTPLSPSHPQSDNFRESSAVGTTEALMSLCSNILTTRADGMVDFSKRPMRRFLLESRLVNEAVCHETMTRICFVHLQRAGSLMVTKPWAKFYQMLDDFAAKPFLRYARKYWRRHYRLSESTTMDLPSQLFGMIEIAVKSELYEERLAESSPLGDDYLSIDVHQIVLATALDLSIFYSFDILKQCCEEMGAICSASRLAKVENISWNNSSCHRRCLETLKRPHDLVNNAVTMTTPFSIDGFDDMLQVIDITAFASQQTSTTEEAYICISLVGSMDGLDDEARSRAPAQDIGWIDLGLQHLRLDARSDLSDGGYEPPMAAAAAADHNQILLPHSSQHHLNEINDERWHIVDEADFE